MSDALAPALAAFVEHTSPDTIAAAGLEATVIDRIVDSVGVSLAARTLETSQMALRLAQRRAGRGEADILGHDQQVPGASAAFVNGVLAHSLDFDDTHLPSILHPSASVVPAALAAAQVAGADGAALVAAVAAGLEVCVRVGMAGYDAEHKSNVWFDRGQHATSICGTVGAAAAAAKLSGLDATGIAHAIAISASMASGVIEANRGGGTVKRMHCGWAAQSGITAAELAQAGFTGPATALEGRFGLFTAFLGDRFNESSVADGLGERWLVPDIQVKPYPANHFTHTVLDAAAALRARGITAEDIESITVGVPSAIVRTIGEPLEAKQRPETGYQAQFSAAYAVCVGLLGGRALGAALEDYTDELARDPRRRAIMATVTVEPDAECDAIYPHEFPAVLTARLRDGRTERCAVLANRGGRRRPLDAQDVSVKFLDNAGRVLPADRADAVLKVLRSITDQPNLTAVFTLARNNVNEV